MQKFVSAAVLAAFSAGLALGGEAVIRFIDKTKERGLACLHHEPPYSPSTYEGHSMLFGIGAAAADYNRDGHIDLYICDSYLHRDMLMRNNGDGTFTDVTLEAGLSNFGHGAMALFLDLDNDGWDDLIVANEAHMHYNEFPSVQVYRNNGDGTFKNLTLTAGIGFLDSTVGGMTAADYDKDGLIDILIVGWFYGDVRLYRNEGGFRFCDVTEESGILEGMEIQSFFWAPIFADFDNDGWPDLYMAVDFVADYAFRNNRDGTFTNVSEEWNLRHAGNDMGVAVADFDNDGDLDIYTTNVTGPLKCDQKGGCNALYVNHLNGKSGRFEYEQAERGVGDTGWSWGTWFFDVDLDGDLDLLVVNGWAQPEWQTPAKLFINDGNGYFTDVAELVGAGHVGNTRALLPVDLDRDGDIDFLTFDVYGTATLYENVTERNGNRWLTVEARGVESNRNGVGSRVYVTGGGKTQMAEIMAGGSFRAGPLMEAHFGLGPVERVDVRVVFPSGLERVLKGVRTDQRIVVAEPTLRNPPQAGGKK